MISLGRSERDVSASAQSFTRLRAWFGIFARPFGEASRREWLPSVAVEFVALGVFHCYPVVIDALLAQDADHRGTEIS
jgi:hypothetical protein